MQRIIQSFFLLILLLTATPGPLAAATVELPLFLRTQILQNALVESFTPESGKPTVLFQQGSYNYLHITEPRLSIRDGQPYFSCNANASMGFDSLGILPSVVKWEGFVLMRLDFFVDPQWQLRYRILDSAIYNEKGGKPVVTGFAWELSKRFLHPRLEEFGFDLTMPQEDISNLLRACASPADAAPLEAALKTLTVGTLRAGADGITVPLLLTVDNALTRAAAPLPAEAPLGFEELEKLQQAFEPIDAFLVFTIKGLSTDLGDSLHQEQLFDLLITSRHQLLMILTGQAPVENRDPFRQLFIDVWEQLRPIVESSSGKSGLMQKKMLRYMTFINAGDALLTLDRTAPGLGIHLTSDGLRRLARMMQPDSKEDPLHFDWQIDPALRDFFQFQPEPVAPAIEIMPPPLPAGEPPTDPAPPPQTLPPPVPPPANQPARAHAPPVGITLLTFFLGIAHADELPAAIQPTISQRLNRWVPTDEDEAEYERIMGQLLTALALEQVKRDALTPQHTKIFLNLVPAVAMIESCWQHFELKNDKIVVRRNQAGGLGIMQINQHVWRGFYNMDRLQGDVVYNIQAGNQILMRYFKQHAIKVAEEMNAPDMAARAAYAAYNGGPGAVRRFLKTGTNPRLKKIDDHLWKLYQRISAGGSGNLATCDIM